MPPSPRLTTIVDPFKWSALCNELKFPDDRIPTVEIKPGQGRQSGKTYLGFYCTGREHIELYTGFSLHETDRLSAACNRITRTLLHEARHHWQHVTWGHNYYDDVERAENDAIDFADRRLADYRLLVRISRKTVSPLAKQTATVDRLRQRV